jgi:signal peptidase I
MSEAQMANDTNDQPVQPAGSATDSPPAPKAKVEKKESWFETVKTVVYALLIALAIRTLLFQPFNIPSSSMENTLLVGDYLFVEKFAYGYSRYSLPYGHLFPSVGRILPRAPRRGDVIVFKMPNPNSSDYGEDFIKRLIGLPGDTVQVLGGVVYLNGKPIPRTRVADYVETDEFGMVNHVPRYRETLPDHRTYYVLDRVQNGAEDNTPAFHVPAGHYFMMGDNRDNSNDSREDVGFVPAENLVGKAEVIFFSTNGSAHWWEVWRWPWTIRYDRIAKLIQ